MSRKKYNRTREPNRGCIIYDDTIALREAHNQIKALRRGQTVQLELHMSQKALRELKFEYSHNKYKIEGVTDDNAFYKVTVHRNTIFEQLRAKKNTDEEFAPKYFSVGTNW